MESKIIRYFIAVALILIFGMDAFYPRMASSQQNVVRVAVVSNADTFELSVRGRYRIVDLSTNKELDKGRRLKRSRVTAVRGKTVIGRREYLTRRLRIIAQKDVAIYVAGKRRRYREQMDIIRTKQDKFLVINRLDLESYVKGVLYHEVPHRWPLNAIKAQAVATRSYALFQVKVNKDQAYDVRSDIYSQVYGGRSAERHRSNIAVKRTRGQILTYRGKVLPAYFHSNCGGHTENVKILWKHDLPPLRGVKCGFCALKPNYRWKKNFRLKDIQDKLNANGYNLGLIKKIKVTGRTDSGRIKNLKITARDGQSIIIAGTKFRGIIGPNILKSNHYDIDMKGYYFDVSGRGWGHGVGMCQWGVYEMSRKRYTYTSILEYYYPGAKVVKISEL